MGWVVLSVWIRLNKTNNEVSGMPFCSDYISGIKSSVVQDTDFVEDPPKWIILRKKNKIDQL